MYLIKNARARSLLLQALGSDPPRLDWAALAVAALEFPDLEPTRYEQALEALGQRVTALSRGAEPLERIQALRNVLAYEEGFQGNEQDFRNPENSFLNRLLERKLGIPISLSILYLEVARRAHIPLYGVSFPGHFLTAHKLPDGRALAVDPFHGGEILTEEGCQDLLKRVAPQVRFAPTLLSPASPQSITFRMLNNLKRIYLDASDGERALNVVDLMLAVSPDHPGELRARASIFAGLGAYRSALDDIERCLDMSPDAPDGANLHLTAKVLRQRLEFLN